MVGANFKSALKHANNWLSKEENQGPSGTSLEELLFYVCQQMFVQFQSAKDCAGLNRVTKAIAKKYEDACSKARLEGKAAPEPFSPLSEDDMLEDYLFVGYFAFALFCPKGLAKKSLSFLSAKGTDVPKVSRKQQRKNALAEKEVKGTKSAGPDNYNKRGVSQEAAREEKAKKSQNLCDLLCIEATNHNKTLKELVTVNKMISDARNEDEPAEECIMELIAWQHQVMESLRNQRSRKAKLEAESNRLVMLGDEPVEESPSSAGMFCTPKPLETTTELPQSSTTEENLHSPSKRPRVTPA